MMPCPFCGGEAKLIHNNATKFVPSHYMVVCLSCRIHGFNFHAAKDAKHAWDNRDIEHELKNCPFCGHVPEWDGELDFAKIECPNCRAATPTIGELKTSHGKLIEIWNRRI